MITAYIFATKIVQCLDFEDTFSDSTARFVSDLVGNPKDRISHHPIEVRIWMYQYHKYCFDREIFGILFSFTLFALYVYY